LLAKNSGVTHGHYIVGCGEIVCLSYKTYPTNPTNPNRRAPWVSARVGSRVTYPSLSSPGGINSPPWGSAAGIWGSVLILQPDRQRAARHRLGAGCLGLIVCPDKKPRPERQRVWLRTCLAYVAKTTAVIGEFVAPQNTICTVLDGQNLGPWVPGHYFSQSNQNLTAFWPLPCGLPRRRPPVTPFERTGNQVAEPLARDRRPDKSTPNDQGHPPINQLKGDII